VKTVISASRRTDLIAFFPDWLAAALRTRRARVLGPRGGVREVSLAPEDVHTVVLWSKDFRNLLRDAHGLRRLLSVYDQLYLHFTVTGLGGTDLEPGVPPPDAALAELDDLVDVVGDPRRISLRVDPIVFWRDGAAVRTNVPFVETAARRAAAAGIVDLRFSLAQWYVKAKNRAAGRRFLFVDPADEEKIRTARTVAAAAEAHGLTPAVCSQSFLATGAGIRPSSCINGRRLSDLHPRREPAALGKDRSQRPDCLCTESVDIGSYTQSCPHSCVYCYANPEVGVRSRGRGARPAPAGAFP